MRTNSNQRPLLRPSPAGGSSTPALSQSALSSQPTLNWQEPIVAQNFQPAPITIAPSRHQGLANWQRAQHAEQQGRNRVLASEQESVSTSNKTTAYTHDRKRKSDNHFPLIDNDITKALREMNIDIESLSDKEKHWKLLEINRDKNMGWNIDDFREISRINQADVESINKCFSMMLENKYWRDTIVNKLQKHGLTIRKESTTIDNYLFISAFKLRHTLCWREQYIRALANVDKKEASENWHKIILLPPEQLDRIIDTYQRGEPLNLDNFRVNHTAEQIKQAWSRNPLHINEELDQIKQVCRRHGIDLDKFPLYNQRFLKLLMLEVTHETGMDDKHMQRAAKLTSHTAKKIKQIFYSADDDVKTTVSAIKSIERHLEHEQIQLFAKSGPENFVKLLKYSSSHKELAWKDVHLQLIAGINPYDAKDVLDHFYQKTHDSSQQADAQRPLALFNIEAGGSNRDKYLSLQKINQEHRLGWSDSQIRLLSEAHDPTSAEAYSRLNLINSDPAIQQRLKVMHLNLKEFIDTDPEVLTSIQCYRELLKINLAHNFHWPNHHMKLLSGITEVDAAAIRSQFETEHAVISPQIAVLENSLKALSISAPVERYSALIERWPEHQSSHEDMQIAAGLASDHIRVKSESETQSPLVTTRWHEVPLDSSRSIFYPEYADLTGAGVNWVIDFKAKNYILIRHSMQPDSTMDNIFPIRDPYNVKEPLPAYADPGLAEVGKVTIRKGFKAELNRIVAEDKYKPRSERRLNLSSAEIDKKLRALEKSVSAELKRTLNQEPHSNPVTTVVRLKAEELPEHEKMLAGEYGLRLRPNIKESDRPLLSKGKILGLYHGSKLENQTHIDHNNQIYGEEEVSRYHMGSGIGEIILSAVGGSSSVGFINTCLDPEYAEPSYDMERMNTLFLPFDVEMVTINGEKKTEGIIAATGLDTLRPGDEARVSYGPEFLEKFAQHAEEENTKIKQEDGNEATMLS